MPKAAASPKTLFLGEFPSPLGVLLIVFDNNEQVCALDFQDYQQRMTRLLRIHYGDPGKGYSLCGANLPESVSLSLAQYFEGNVVALDKIPVITNGTEFQKTVWADLRKIKPGSTLSYGELANHIGRPSAVRAVGLANGANPIALIVPCHRVIGRDGSLTGYAGGMDRKQWLLKHEGVVLAASQMRLV